MSTLALLKEKIAEKNARIGIYGLGYVGLPLVIRFIEEGFRVFGFDVDEEKLCSLKKHKSYIRHISDEKIKYCFDQGFEVSSSFEETKKLDALIICVPTPLNKYREPDLSFVFNTVDSIQNHLKRGQIVCLESTTYPGTCEEDLLPRLEKSSLKVGSDIFLVFSPEREDPGRKDFNTQSMPKVVGGISKSCLEAGSCLYSAVVDTVVPVSSTKAAEMTKLLENIHRAVNIGLVNEMKVVADRMNIDIHEVIRAAATKPFGFVPYYPGPGLGGHCIPIDPFYLTWKAREYGLHTRFIELAGEVNSAMPDFVVKKVAYALNQTKKAINGSRVLVVGLAYKKNVDDTRESPSVTIMERLRDMGAQVDYSDPFVPVFPKMREHFFDLKSIELSAENLNHYDAVVIATNHDQIDFSFLLEHSKLIVDTRDVFREAHPKVIKA